MKRSGWASVEGAIDGRAGGGGEDLRGYDGKVLQGVGRSVGVIFIICANVDDILDSARLI